MKHLSDEQLLELAEGRVEPVAAAHAAKCGQCAEDIRELAATLQVVRQVEVPEPSPLFWDHFSNRVRQAVAEEAMPGASAGLSVWSWRRAVVPAVLVLVAAVVLTMVLPTRQQPPVAPVAVAARAPQAENPAPAADEPWTVVASAAEDLDWESAGDAGLGVSPGAADRAVFQLSSDERRELTRIIETELTSPSS